MVKNLLAVAFAVAALSGPQDHLKLWLAEFTKRRNYMLQRLNAIPGVSCIDAKGAFYLLPNISKLGLAPMEFSKQLLDEEKVAVVPGEAFGTDRHIRLSYASSMTNIEKGLDRIERFCRKRAGNQ